MSYGNSAAPYYGNPAMLETCPLCGSTQAHDRGCANCFAPGDILQSIRARGADGAPKFTGVLGPSNVGKTVYLGMLLDLMARGVGNMHGVPRGPFSLALHKNVTLSLERQRFPEKTPNEPDLWQWVHCEVKQTLGKRSRAYDVVAPDVAGEAVANEIAVPNSYPTVRALLGRCSGLVVLVDIASMYEEGQIQEIFAMQLVSYLLALRPPRRGRKLDVPVALVFTKSDLSDEAIGDPESFARANANALYRLCENQLAYFKFFASGVAGSVGMLVTREGIRRYVPLRVEPRGIVEPFAWLFSHYR